MAETWLLAKRCPGYKWRDPSLSSGMELEKALKLRLRELLAIRSTAERDPVAWQESLVVASRSVMEWGARLRMSGC